MIEVLHLIHGLSAGGAETLVKNYFLNFKSNQIKYTLLCLEHRSEFGNEDYLKKAGVNVIYVEDYLPFKKNSNRFFDVINSIIKYCIVRRVIRSTRPDIIHTHLRINSFLKFAKPERGTIIFHTVHSIPKELWCHDDRKKVRDYNAMKWLVKKYDVRFIVLYEEMRDEIKEMFGTSKSTILNNGIDVCSIKNTRPNKELIRKLGIPNNAFIVGHIGRFSKVKNQIFLVKVFSEIERKSKKAFLLMIGDGPDKNIIEKELHKVGLNGKYLILSNRQDIPDLLANMDIFVFPSLYEGVPLSLIEAQVANKPCFISDRVNQKAVISNLVTSLSLDDGAKRWADIILSYKNPQKINVSDQSWDIRKITKQLEQLYMNALTGENYGKK